MLEVKQISAWPASWTAGQLESVRDTRTSVCEMRDTY